ncbi:chromodomain-helicase-DNA-binding protein 5 [Planoprotostelium fungivorum]|uniref:Chromodomain-helicase-DNA-binding protein 5 n=1 Tax=Planoprotostelium fungivorum TaxID=1890364 RepID=A0A2P6NVU5_9EUKA|nr:chromodomain-helicase-DNA-binding protein 5 [Planoprotostelium fungivorum]
MSFSLCSQDFGDKFCGKQPRICHAITARMGKNSDFEETGRRSKRQPVRSTRADERASKKRKAAEDTASKEVEYEVEDILDRRQVTKGRKTTMEYLIKWKGYPESDNTWEAQEHIFASELLEEFERNQKKSRASRSNKSNGKSVYVDDSDSDISGSDYPAEKSTRPKPQKTSVECGKCHKHMSIPSRQKKPSKGWLCEDCSHNCIYCDKSDKKTRQCTSCDLWYHPACSKENEVEAPYETGETTESDENCAECNYGANMGKVEKILSVREAEDGLSPQYLIKWEDLSHLKNTWEPRRRINCISRRKLANFDARFEGLDEEEKARTLANMVREEWGKVDRIVDRRTSGDKTEYLIKWEALPYSQLTWEDEKIVEGHKDKVEKFEASLVPQKLKKKKSSEKEVAFQEYKNQPSFLPSQLYPWQLEGLNWLVYSMYKKRNVILADEMGLGKTIQSMSFILHCSEACHNPGPFLIVAPLSTISNWEREFIKWAPHLNLITYTGDNDSRENIRLTLNRKYEFKHEKGYQPRFNAVLTTYELARMEAKHLKKFDWQVLIVDEGHRLKNAESKSSSVLSDYKIEKIRILLTGTPLQNNIGELFALLQFLEPEKFPELEDLEKEFADLSDGEKVSQLHKMLHEYILRRTKNDVETPVPPKAEFVVLVELSPLQKQWYKALLTKNYGVLNSNPKSGGVKTSLLNVLMQLRKCCNHPYLFPEVEPSNMTKEEEMRLMIEASGKLWLLDRMLEKLKAGGHRVLIFSQMTKMLDILEDYLHHKKWKYARLDGDIRAEDRTHSIKKFNEKDSEEFVFLLSTRAGGLGINLHTADTVILYDSDFNPHNDIQALSRAHRIGQLKKVMIYRLVTNKTCEEGIVQRAKDKLILEHIVVKSVKEKLKDDELQAILRYGAEELFTERERFESLTVDDMKDLLEKNNISTEDCRVKSDYERKITSYQLLKSDTTYKPIHYDDAAIDKLLDRSQEELKEEKKEGKMDFFNPFKVAKVWENDGDTQQPVNDSANDFWNKLLEDRVSRMEEEERANMGKGKRERKQRVQYHEDDSDVDEISDVDYDPDNNAKEEESDYSGDDAVPEAMQDSVVTHGPSAAAPSGSVGNGQGTAYDLYMKYDLMTGAIVPVKVANAPQPMPFNSSKPSILAKPKKRNRQPDPVRPPTSHPPSYPITSHPPSYAPPSYPLPSHPPASLPSLPPLPMANVTGISPMGSLSNNMQYPYVLSQYQKQQQQQQHAQQTYELQQRLAQKLAPTYSYVNPGLSAMQHVASSIRPMTMQSPVQQNPVQQNPVQQNPVQLQQQNLQKKFGTHPFPTSGN